MLRLRDAFVGSLFFAKGESKQLCNMQSLAQWNCTEYVKASGVVTTTTWEDPHRTIQVDSQWASENGPAAT